MPTVINVVSFVRGTLVVLFAATSVLILCAGLIRRFRFDCIRMSWGTGKLFGLPLGPTLFLGVVLTLVTYTVLTGERVFAIGWVTTSAYVGGGLCWYLGALLSGSTVITDWGISTKIGRRQGMLPWHEITDYVVTRHRRSDRYVFFRVDAQGYKRRTEVHVPLGVTERFRSIVEFRLDNRFNRSIQRPMGQQALEQ